MTTESIALAMIKWAMSMAKSEPDLRAFVDVECNRSAIESLSDADKSEARDAYSKERERLRCSHDRPAKPHTR